MNTLFTQSLDIRVAYAKAEIYGDEITQYEAEIEAHIWVSTRTAPASRTYPSCSKPFLRSVELGAKE